MFDSDSAPRPGPPGLTRYGDTKPTAADMTGDLASQRSPRPTGCSTRRRARWPHDHEQSGAGSRAGRMTCAIIGGMHDGEVGQGGSGQ